jgi:hypothetical protein
MMKRITLAFMAVMITVVAGCGYTTSSLLPPEMDSIHVSNFVNRVDPTREVSDRRMSYNYWPGLENQVTRGVIDGFIFDRHLDVKRESAAVLLLKGELMDYRQTPLSYDGADNVEELRIEILVNLELYDNRTGELIWKENNFMGWSSYDLSGPNKITQAEGVNDAVKDLSLRIVERVVEKW